MKGLDIEKQIKNLGISKNKIFYQEPMKKHTTFQIGGPAEYLILVEEIEELKRILQVAKQKEIPVTIMGNGSNVLVLDKGIKGITLMIKIEKIEFQEKNEQTEMIVGAGEKLGKLAQLAKKQQLTGLEELSGIPGTLGGAGKNECRSPWQRNKRFSKSSKMFGL